MLMRVVAAVAVLAGLLAGGAARAGNGMDLKFTRVRDGQPMRTVTGKLAKVGD